jgi:hypothetical protein
MYTLEVPIPESPIGVDAVYDDRHQLIEKMRDGGPLISARPVIIGRLADRETFADCQQLPGRIMTSIEFEYNQDTVRYYLADQFAPLREAIQVAATYEHSMYPQAAYLENAVTLTLDHRDVVAGRAQRGDVDGGAHRDGGGYEWLHFYVVSDAYPTEFFEVSNPGVEGYYSGSTLETSELGEPFVPQEYEIACANTTALHRSPVIEEGGKRTFLRIVYEHDLGD